ncbi:hypothetical protein CLU79DRAFT_750397 [Phycomyces nitens]|nr:hypothetical protein CLU79DRAFT_750397 [Phycomyces nitens]
MKDAAISNKMKKKHRILRQDIAKYTTVAANMLVLLALLPEEMTNPFYKIGGVYFYICLLLVVGSSFSMKLSFINKKRKIRFKIGTIPNIYCVL